MADDVFDPSRLASTSAEESFDPKRLASTSSSEFDPEKLAGTQQPFSQRQSEFRKQIRTGNPELAAQASSGIEFEGPPAPEPPKTGMFLDRDEKGNLIAKEMPVTGGREPEGAKRITEAAKAAFGQEPVGISPETLKKYPSLGVLQPFAAGADIFLRDINAAIAGGAGTVAAVAERYGMSPAEADRLQRDIYQGVQVAGAEMPKPTPGMMTAPVVKRAVAEVPPPPPPPGGGLPKFLQPTSKGISAELPTVPVAEGLPVPEVRGKGARLLPPEVSHEPIKVPEQTVGLPGRAGVGAQGAAGPLEGISPEAINQVARQLKADNWTPFTIDERLEKMSPHQFFAEVSPNLENRASQVAAYGGEGRNTIKSNVDQRHAEIKPRLKVLYDEAFGPVENLAQEKKVLTADQKAAADKFYEKFRDTPIHPTEELKSIMPRLEAAGAFGEAKKIASVEGKPWEENFFTVGNRKNYPTAESWDYVKRALDSKIEGSFNQFGEPTNWTRIYTQLKNELVNAIDNHPNPEVAGIWKEARDAYAGPARIKNAYEVGKKVFSEALDANELPFMTASYSPKELEAVAAGIRYNLENQLGRAGSQEGRSIRQILSENNQNKIRWLIGDEKAEKLFNAVDLENQIHGSQKRLIGGSPTAERTLGAKEEFGARPPRAAELAGQVAETGFGLVKDPKGTVTKAVSKLASEKMTRAAEEKAAKLRADIARIYTLQGPERDAALRWILEHGENWTGAPEIKVPGLRSTGGSVFDKMHEAKKRADGGETEKDASFWEKAADKLSQTWPARMAKDVAAAAMAPGHAYQSTPDNPVTTEQMIKPAADLAGMVMGGSYAAPAMKDAAGMGIRAYHGSPHNYSAERLVLTPNKQTEYLVGKPNVLPEIPSGYELIKDFPIGRMRLDKIGTGEGAQAYGHGLYLAEAEPVARNYKDVLTDRASSFRVENIDMPKWILRGIEASPDRAAAIAQYRKDFSNRLLEAQKEAEGSVQPWLASGRISSAKDILAGLDALERGASMPHTAGHMYEIDIKAHPEQFLDWDKPLSQQSAVVRNSVMRLAQEAPMPDKGPTIRNRQAILSGDGSVPGDVLYNNIGGFSRPGETSQKLLDAGIPGIKYLDQGSRGAGEDSRNYVVFDDKLIDILRKYGILAPFVAGAVKGGTENAEQ